ncbi:MAG: thioredoxin fold domain-containing protein [Bacteroidales bacterium]|nr:thioredoxin fold domain-containing protein [Bacteroidales bacterium]
MKNRKLFSLAIGLMIAISFSACNSDNQGTQSETVSESTVSNVKPEHLTTVVFKQKVWDYENFPEQWNFKGEIPVVIDFYADWCKPCKMIAPIMDDLADYYKGRVKFYKVNTDRERELATVFQVRSIPMVLFAPLEGKPVPQTGAMSKEQYIKIIDEFVLGINNDNNKQEI